MKPATGLVRQHTVLLASAFIAIELLVVLAFVWLVMLPLARRSADDLAGLMVLSAQTWAELPPATRPAFETELRLRQALRIQPDVAGVSQAEWHPPFFYLLEEALVRRVSPERHLIRTTDAAGDDWFWARLPAGGGTLAVGLSSERINSRPLAVLLIGLAAGLAVAVGLALLLARRVVAPLARLEQASAQLGQGEAPALLPETGPREIVALSRRFNTMAVQVRELLSARTTLLAGVSHDLRTPLARMRLALEMLRTQPSASLLDRLERDMELMDQLIGNVLDLARGLAHEPATPVDLAALLQALASEHSTAACLVQVRCPPCVRAVPALSLRRALGNLLQNALRYAPSCPVELVCEQDGAECRLGVLDRGPGIPADQVEAMFHPFQRLEPSRSPKTGGSGLGLAIVRELAQANGWRVSLSPRPGGGMQAWVVL
ncbi:integral membrane sensor signal transduction histidine kinase [Hydrogenophaga taeniospiralis CCUG 15921]|uniref:histidine kinase n=1 Tax=Hydrogenophaga taeniospiralis CCUG 15921 TaxID=1281780 RepID=A0A9X4SA68_9BURK|nr:ATP-binding protein [Hydrogenophaga taeniospiralis]MDG5978452.1 integral membrane sensor signal transduction histidine kinase [Hydrogenophaga taeniospiralis CCUG 15921]